MELFAIEIASIVLFFISFFCLITSKSIIKTIIAITLMETAVILFILGAGFSPGAAPPIGKQLENVSDPLPQALVITSIIIGVAVTAINLIMLITLCRQHGTPDWDAPDKMKME